MPLEAARSPSNRYACLQCIADRVLINEIRLINRYRTCSYCERRRLAVSIEALADRIDEVYHQVIRFGEEYPVADPNSDNPIWKSDGNSAGEIIQELIQCDTMQTASDIASILSTRYAYDVGADGETDWFDNTSDVYKIEIPRYSGFYETWISFRESIKHSGRFFNADATALLGQILDPILNEEWPRTGSAIRTIQPTEEDRFIYRGRQANGAAARTAIFRSPIRELSAPPPHLNVAGRMNAAGIGAFYGSFDRATCIAELRVPVGGEAIVGKFEIIRPLRVLDLTALELASDDISFFEENFVEMFAYSEFVKGFHAEIRKPVVPGSETLEYLPTQFVCEYLWTQANPVFDGLIYGSSQLSNSASNIVLFPHAIEVDGYDTEQPLDVTDLTSSLSEEDSREIVWFNEAAPLPELVAGFELSRKTLRLMPTETVVCHVQGIRYEIDERSVTRLANTLDLPEF